jgi:hypothetical protein
MMSCKLVIASPCSAAASATLNVLSAFVLWLSQAKLLLPLLQQHRSAMATATKCLRWAAAS